MTQALINKLNIIPETKSDLTNNLSKKSGMDFGKIFETKTKKIEKNGNTPDTNTVQKAGIETDKTDSNSNTKQIINDDKGIQKDYKNKSNDNTDIKTETVNAKSNNNDKGDETDMKLLDVIQTCIKDDLTDSEEIEEVINDNIINISEDDLELILTEENSDNTDETIITEEEPTMYNELITLEDPTALLMLQSQIQKTITVNVPVEQTEITEDGCQNNQNLNSNTDTNSTNNASVFKQLDTQIARNVNAVKNQPAEPPHSKPTAQKSSNVLNESIIKELNVEVLSSQSAEAESSMGDLMQNQSPQEQTARIMIQGDIKYESIASETAKNVSQTTTQSFTPGRIIEQISKQLENMVNNSKLNMVLNPGSLGKLNLQIINSKDGILAQFTVTTPEARDILMKGLSVLKENLLAQGVSIDNVSVRLENTESEYESDYTEQEENSKGGYKHQEAKKQKENGKNFEEMMFNLENEENV